MLKSFEKVDDTVLEKALPILGDSVISVMKARVDELYPAYEENLAKRKAELDEYFRRGNPPSNASPTTHATLVEVWEAVRADILKMGGVVAGGFVSSFMNWDDRKVPGDMDIWLPEGFKFWPHIEGWFSPRCYCTSNSKNMPPNVKCIQEFINPKYQLKLQFLYTTEDDPTKIIENFDFDVCKGIMSPALDDKGEVIGVRATRPEIRAAIMSNTATFLERPWDLDEDGNPNSKALNRFRKYAAKGYKLVVHKNSKFTLDLIKAFIESDVAALAAKNSKPSDEPSYGPDEEEKQTYSYLRKEIDIMTHVVYRSMKPYYYTHAYDYYSKTDSFPEDYDFKSVYHALNMMSQTYESLAERSKTEDRKYMTWEQRSKLKRKEHKEKLLEQCASYLKRTYA
jgi:hypothetical protein